MATSSDDTLRSPLGQAIAGQPQLKGHENFAHKLAIGHQEIDIVDEIEQIYSSQPPVVAAGTMGNMIVMLSIGTRTLTSRGRAAASSSSSTCPTNSACGPPQQ